MFYFISRSASTRKPVFSSSTQQLSLSVFAIFSISICSYAQAEQPASVKQHLFEAADIFELEVATDPQVSPDGESILYVRRANDIMTDATRSSIWYLDAGGDTHRPVVSSSKNAFSPRWSPAGDKIAYLSNQDGSTQLYVRWMDTGQTALITNLASSPSSITWSPNGQQIAFTMNVKANEQPFSVKMPEKPKGAQWADDFEYISKARY